MTPTRARGRRPGIRQTQTLREMVRRGGRWPQAWMLRDSQRATMATLVRRGWVESLENPVLTTEGRNLAFWL